MLRNLDSFFFFFFLIVKIILLESASVFSTLAEAKTQCFVHLSVSATLLLIKSISIYRQKMLRYFNGTAAVALFKTELIQSETVLSNNLVSYSKDLKALFFSISALN